MVRSFYPWVENPSERSSQAPQPSEMSALADGLERDGGEPEERTLTDFVSHEARIAVVDDPSVAPRVSIVDPAPIRDYVESITQTTYTCARDQGGSIPFMVIREVVENLIHAYFTDPVVTILPGGNTIRFSDRGPGIASKERALEYGTTTATEEMKRYIRGVGSGLPYVLHFLSEKGGSLTIEDNLTSGTVVTMSLEPAVSRETLVRSFPSPQVDGLDFQEAAKRFTIGEAERETQPSPIASPLQAQSPTTAGPDPILSQSDRQILTYLATHANVGPKDLANAYGSSISTWSRRLAELESKGLVEKRGQKRYLTREGSRLSTLLTGL